MDKISYSATAKQKLHDFIAQVNPEIEAFFVEKRLEVERDFGKYSLDVFDVYKEIVMRGGKRLRSSFVYYVYRMFSDEKLDEVMRAAVLVEMVHAFFLVIDDYTDLSDTRRSGPTAHILLKDYHKQNFAYGDSKHFGDSMAVTVGIAAYFMANNILFKLNFPPERIIEFAKSLNNHVETTAQGQINDIINSVRKDVNEDEVLNVLKWKTGVYTYENPINAGAVLAGHPEDSKLLSGYAIPAGIAFQIQDDILGVFGNEEDTGKSTMDDLKEGKYTLLVDKALKEASPAQLKELRLAIGNKEITPEQFERTKEIMVATGALAYSKDVAQSLVAKAKDHLLANRQTHWKEEGFHYLLGIADYMIEREL